MTTVIDQFNALVTSVRMVENENEKLKTKLEAIETEEKQIKEDLTRAEEDLKKSEIDFNTLKEDHVKAMATLDADLEKAKKEVDAKKEEKDLYFEIKQLEKEIEGLKTGNEFLNKELEEVKAGKLTPNFAKHLQVKLTQGKEDENKKLLAHFKKHIKIDKSQPIVNMQTIERIFDATIQFYSKTHVVRSYEDRIERRKHLSDMDKYVDIAVRQLNDFDNSVDNSQLELLEHLGLTLDQFSASVEYYFTQGNQDVYLLTSMLPQRLKMFMPSRKRINADTVRDLLKYQKEILNNEFLILDVLKKYKDDLTPDRVTTLLSNRLLDKVYEKFNVEEEDLTAAMQTQECRNSQEIKNLLMDIRKSILETAPRAIANTFGNEMPQPQVNVNKKK